MTSSTIEDLDCPECSMPHEDINEWINTTPQSVRLIRL